MFYTCIYMTISSLLYLSFPPDERNYEPKNCSWLENRFISYINYMEYSVDRERCNFIRKFMNLWEFCPFEVPSLAVQTVTRSQKPMNLSWKYREVGKFFPTQNFLTSQYFQLKFPSTCKPCIHMIS